MYDNPWTFEGKVFETEDINGFFGFVYVITSLIDGKKYIGRKYFYSFRKKKGSKRRQKSESDWKEYYGSSDELKEEIEDLEAGTYTLLVEDTTTGCDQQFTYTITGSTGPLRMINPIAVNQANFELFFLLNNLL